MGPNTTPVAGRSVPDDVVSRHWFVDPSRCWRVADIAVETIQPSRQMKLVKADVGAYDRWISIALVVQRRARVLPDMLGKADHRADSSRTNADDMPRQLWRSVGAA